VSHRFARAHIALRRRSLFSLGLAPLGFAASLGCNEGTDDGLGQAGSGGTLSSGGMSGAAGQSGSSAAGTSAGSGHAAGNAGASVGQGGSAGSSGSGGATAGASGAAATSGQGGSGGASGGAAGQGGTSSGGAAGVAGAAGLGGASGAAGTSGASGSGGSGGNGADPSMGCNNEPTLENGDGSVMSGGMERTYELRLPDDYDNTHPYRLMLGFHGANGNSSQVAPSYFGLWTLSEGSTIFVAPDAVDGLWNATRDTAMVSDLIEQLSNDLCIDTSRIGIEGFSQGGAMVWTLACALPGTFRFAVVHSGGGLPMPQSCEPIPFFSALGTDGSGQDMSSDYFAQVNGCTVEPLPEAPSGGHACTNYDDCDEGFPTRWCDYDAGHLPDPRDAGQNSSWVPGEVWNFITDY
jgi:hypothetical protein